MKRLHVKLPDEGVVRLKRECLLITRQTAQTVRKVFWNPKRDPKTRARLKLNSRH